LAYKKHLYYKKRFYYGTPPKFERAECIKTAYKTSPYKPIYTVECDPVSLTGKALKQPLWLSYSVYQHALLERFSGERALTLHKSQSAAGISNTKSKHNGYQDNTRPRKCHCVAFATRFWAVLWNKLINLNILNCIYRLIYLSPRK
jgi:hypothetical protein